MAQAELPGVGAMQAEFAECLKLLWQLKNAAVVSDHEKCKSLIAELKGHSARFEAVGMDMAFLDERKLECSWWFHDVKDACIAFVLQQRLMALCKSLEMTPDMKNVKPYEVVRSQLDVAISRCICEDDVKNLGGTILKAAVQNLQNIRNSVQRASGDLTRAIASKKRREENAVKAEAKKVEAQAAKQAKEMEQAVKKGAAGGKVTSPLMDDEIRARLSMPVREFANYEAFSEASSKDSFGSEHALRDPQEQGVERARGVRELTEVHDRDLPGSVPSSFQ